MSFTQMKRDDLYALATQNFAVEVSETATKPQIIAALAEEGVTWEMAKTFDKAAAELDEEVKAPAPNVITSASIRPEPEVVSYDPVVEEVEVKAPANVSGREEISGYITLLVPKGVDGVVQGGVFYPNRVVEEPVVLEAITSTTGRLPFAQRPASGVLLKMDRENPSYDIRGYRFTQQNPFVVVAEVDADYILTHEDGFKVASPGEAKEFYG